MYRPSTRGAAQCIDFDSWHCRQQVEPLWSSYSSCVACGQFKVTEMNRLTNLSSTHRSEEHTSELQSLMRISYAVFCLKNKNKTLMSTSTYIKTIKLKYKKTNKYKQISNITTI